MEILNWILLGVYIGIGINLIAYKQVHKCSWSEAIDGIIQITASKFK